MRAASIVTWLPLERADRPGLSERAAVLALQQHAADLWLDSIALTWSIAGPELLDLCRLRIAQLHDCRAELDGIDPGRLAELETWRASTTLGPREQAALAYTEQFVIDQNGISEEQRADLSRFLPRRELCNFVQALNAHDGYLRTLSLLDVDPDEARPAVDRAPLSRHAPAPEPATLSEEGLDLFAALTDPAFYEARGAFGAATALLEGVDEVTTEACRLRNAQHQACRF